MKHKQGKLANHRVVLPITVDTDVSIVLKKEIQVNNFTGGAMSVTDLVLYFGVAGYKNEIVFGTDTQYVKGGMANFGYIENLWYNLYIDGYPYNHRHLILTTDIDANGNLIGYIGSDLPLKFDKEDRSVSTECILLTPIEYKLLERELKKDRELFLKAYGSTNENS